jgi:hypothetical protein
MHLQHHLRYPQNGGRLFIEESAGDEGQDLALSGCQRPKAFSQSRQFGPLLACPAILGKGRPYRLKECGQVDRLGKELDSPSLHRTDSGGTSHWPATKMTGGFPLSASLRCNSSPLRSGSRAHKTSDMVLGLGGQSQIPQSVLDRHRLDGAHRGIGPARPDLVLDVRLVRGPC